MRQIEGVRVTLRWWEQSVIDWDKAKAKEMETDSMSGSDLGADMVGEVGRETESRASGSSGVEWSRASAGEWS